MYIYHWLISFIDKLIIYKDAIKERFLLYHLENAWIKSLSLLFIIIVIKKFKDNVLPIKNQSYCVEPIMFFALIFFE